MTAGRPGDEAAVLAGLRAGKSTREIAVELYGADLVAAEWPDYDGALRARMRRLARRARAVSDKGPANAGPGTR